MRTARTVALIPALAATLSLLACSTPASQAPQPQSPTGPTWPGTSDIPPGRILDLTNWYLTLPTGPPGEPDTVTQPTLATYSSPWFHAAADGRGVVFTADAGGATTKGSSYPRSELREMDGTRRASWSDLTGRHLLTAREAIITLPQVKPDVVAAQIHNDSSDVIEIRLKNKRLLVEQGDGGPDLVIDPDYRLGTPYDLTILAQDGNIRVSYNGQTKADIATSGSGWYFKAGSYVQSNPDHGDAPTATGTVLITALKVDHQP
jgi:Alginate lyase